MSRTFGGLIVVVSMCVIVLNFVSLQKWNKIDFDEQVAYAEAPIAELQPVSQ